MQRSQDLSCSTSDGDVRTRSGVCTWTCAVPVPLVQIHLPLTPDLASASPALGL